MSIVDEQRPSGTPAALQALNFDFSSKSGIDLLRGALGVGGDSEEEEYWKIDPPTDSSDDVEAAFDTTNIVLAIVARDGVKYEEWEGRAIGYYNATKQQIGSE